MAESVLATFTDVKFIQGETLMTQENWQSYFSALPNGIVSGFTPMTTGSPAWSFDQIADGVVFANGIRAELSTDNGVTNIGTYGSLGVRDRFVCVRIHFDSETAELVQKTNIAAEGATQSEQDSFNTWTYMNFVCDESYQCTRNSSYWDIPIMYAAINVEGDLRRTVDLSRKPVTNPACPWGTNWYGGYLLSWRNRYNYLIPSNTTVNFYPDPIDLADGAIFTVTAGSNVVVRMPELPYAASVALNHGNTLSSNGNVEVQYVFSNPAMWTHSGDYYTRAVSNTTKSFRVTYSGMDYRPLDNMYELTFSVEEFNNSANVSWGNITGNISSQSDLGYFATLDTLSYTSTRLSNKPTLGALADHDTVNYETEVTNKPTLGDLASQDTVDYDTEVTNKPTLGTMASVNDAASDGKEYVRKNGAWTEVTGPTSLVWGNISGTLSDQTDLQTALNAKANTSALAAKAPLASPALTGTPTAPTPSSDDDSTRVATTAFVQNLVDMASGNATTIYVAANGSDKYGNGSSGNPYKTIGKAVNISGGGYRTIYVAAGSYAENITIPRNLSVTITTANIGDVVAISCSSTSAPTITVDGGSLTLERGDFTISHTADNTVEVINNGFFSTGVGVSSSGLSHDVTISAPDSAFTSGLLVDYGGRATLNALSMTRFTGRTGISCRHGGTVYAYDPFATLTGVVFDAQGGIIIYNTIAEDSTYSTLASATYGGIISTGSGHIFS